MRAASIAVLAVALSGCAMFGAKRHASYAVVAPPSQTQAMVVDSLAELVKLYPPAISRVSIDATASDYAFGQALAEGLRKRGYAVVEAGGKGAPDPAALPLRYVLDEPMPGFYRVMLRVGDQSLTRGYSVGEAGVAPSAGWALNLSGASPELVARAELPDLPAHADIPRTNVAAIGGDTAAPMAGPVRVAMVETARLARADVTRRAALRHVRAAPVTRVVARPRTVTTSWRVQFAAFQTEQVARQHWQSLVHKRPALAAITPRYTIRYGMTFVQAGPYQTIASARAVCGGLSANACIVVNG